MIAATRELLESEGYAGLSLAAVAARSGTNTPAIYRRWESKVHLVHEAVFPESLASGLPATGDLRSDVEALVRGSAALFSDPVARAALPGLLSDLVPHPDLHRELMDRLWVSRVGEMQRLLDAAADQGEVRRGVRAEHLLNVIGGGALLAVLTPGEVVLDEEWIASICTLAMEGITA
ncbi:MULTISPECIES: TetR/AcrR family transcriptional regulator [unclassified Nocardioides]|uniref:TetR/AcrR family transcriptional regulator n=1 Tax=unclassified Nocardioides TaxID=2615069 RepID=UPI000A96C36B|nr:MULTISPECIES: TetR/AcrR family transcriptional regulator [unclassified Nocardioides]